MKSRSLSWPFLCGTALLLSLSGCGSSSSSPDGGATGGSGGATGGSGGGATGGSGGGATGGSGGGATGGSGGGATGGSGGAVTGGTGGGVTGGSGGTTLPHFSFFVTSLKALQDLSGSENGFGGDLRFGETGPGAGLRGADKICATIAERSMTGAGQKQWRAFLSAVAGEDGAQVNAIDRIGNGPWYDRMGRVFAMTKADLLFTRPQGADPAIINDFPNEDGVPNHQPDPNQPQVDNHDMLTGSNSQGQLYSATATCLDWTSALGNRTTEGRPRVGHSWPRTTGGGGGSFGGMDMNNWISALDESGCAAGINLAETGGPSNTAVTVGSGGGYGGFYCFALTP